jgi:YgiT-type zinc finger domain-containing protein
MEERVTDLPFKIGDTSIVIVRALPVLQCRQRGETELEHDAMGQSVAKRRQAHFPVELGLIQWEMRV